MFSKGNVKPQDGQKKVHISTSDIEDDIWLTGEQDALHIPLLSAELNNESSDNQLSPNLLNPFGIYITKTKQNKQKFVQKPAQSNSKPVIGVYALTKESTLSLQKVLVAQHPELSVLNFDSSMSNEEFKQRTCNMSCSSMWIVNLSDDDESPLLGSVLESSAACSTLYLSGALSTQCKHKINDFINTGIVHYANA